jgi:hypothetical protein
MTRIASGLDGSRCGNRLNALAVLAYCSFLPSTNGHGPPPCERKNVGNLVIGVPGLFVGRLAAAILTHREGSQVNETPKGGAIEISN